MRAALTLCSLLLVAAVAAAAGGLEETPSAPSVPVGQRLRVPITEVIELEEDALGPEVPLSHGPAFALGADGIGPGSHLIITIPGEGTFGCTANYLWQSGSNLYLGAAGHCFLPASKTATHGPGWDYNASGVITKVCVSQCYFGGQTGFIVTGVLKTLGPVAYARQTAAGGDIGNDFGMVVIPGGATGALAPYLRSQMPTWGGPSAEGAIGLGPVVHFGYGLVTGETFPTMARAGVGTVSSPGTGHFLMVGAANLGDSGSAVNTAAASTNQGLHGDRAGGVLTHLVAGAGDIAGTLVSKCKSMTSSHAGISITVNTTL